MWFEFVVSSSSADIQLSARRTVVAFFARLAFYWLTFHSGLSGNSFGIEFGSRPMSRAERVEPKQKRCSWAESSGVCEAHLYDLAGSGCADGNPLHSTQTERNDSSSYKWEMNEWEMKALNHRQYAYMARVEWAPTHELNEWYILTYCFSFDSHFLQLLTHTHTHFFLFYLECQNVLLCSVSLARPVSLDTPLF